LGFIGLLRCRLLYIAGGRLHYCAPLPQRNLISFHSMVNVPR
jgi:hypothetical protein